MTHLEFRKDKKLVAQWEKELDKNGLLRLVLFDVMETWNPARHSIAGDNNADISPTRASIELGVTRGYSMYAERLKILATRSGKTEKELGETTYAPDDNP